MRLTGRELKNKSDRKRRTRKAGRDRKDQSDRTESMAEYELLYSPEGRTGITGPKCKMTCTAGQSLRFNTKDEL
jgi:hypothetical protein